MRVPAAIALFAALLVATVAAVPPWQNPFLGRWNITGTGDDAANVYWLEVRDEGGQLAASFLNRTGSPLTPPSIHLEGNELVWTAPQGRGGTIEFRGHIEGGRLVGSHALPVRGRRGGGATPADAASTRTINWVGVRPPDWPVANASGTHTWGEPVVLFDGTSLDAFGVQLPQRPMGWTIENGVMTNGDGGNNLVSKQTFMDFKVEAEYRLAEDSNSGIYLRGRYELQLLGDYGKTGNPIHGHMAIFGRTPPLTNATRPEDEWQQMEAVIVGNRVTATLNGRRVHDNQVIEGITGGALDADETAPGPLLIQGDHSGVWIRRIVVTPITAAGR